MKTKPLIVAFVFLFVLLGAIYLLVGREAPVRRNSLDEWALRKARAAAPSPPGATTPADPTGASAAGPASVPDAQPNNVTRMSAAARENFAKGTAALQESRYSDAVAAYQLALQEDPKNPLLHLALATSYEGLKDWENAYRSMKTYAQLARGAKVP